MNRETKETSRNNAQCDSASDTNEESPFRRRSRLKLEALGLLHYAKGLDGDALRLDLIKVSFDPLLEAAATMMEAIADWPAEERPTGQALLFVSHVQAIFKKAFFHFKAIADLRRAPGIKALGKEVFMPDFVTSKALSRILFETVVVFRFIFDHQVEDERVFWHDVWAIQGHLQRECYRHEKTSKDPNQTYEQLYFQDFSNNESDLQACRDRVVDTEFFQQLPYAGQKAALAGNWRNIADPLSWSELAKRVDLRESSGGVGYKHSSSFIHTDAISVWQLTEPDVRKHHELYSTAATEALQYFAHAIETYWRLWPELRTLPAVETAQPYVERWRDLGAACKSGATPPAAKPTEPRRKPAPPEVFTLGVAIRQRATSTVDTGVATGSPFTNL